MCSHCDWPRLTMSLGAQLRTRSALDDRLALRLGDGPPPGLRTRAALDDRLALGFRNIVPGTRPDMSSRNEDLARDDVHVVDENHARRPGPPEHRAVRGPPPRSIHYQRIVVADVHVLRIDRLHCDRRALLIDLLLAVAAQVPGGLRALPQGLHRSHGLRLLAEEGVAQVDGPLRALAHPREHVGIRDERFHARLPRLVLHHLHRVVAAYARIADGAGPEIGRAHV